MFKKTSSRLVVLTLALIAPVVMAAGSGNEVKLNCPAGTKQRPAAEKGAWFCAKTDPQSRDRSAHGPFKSFHPNGQKRVEGQHTDGMQTGLWKYYDENGRMTEEIEYSAHHYHGRRVQYFPSGKVKLEERWVQGKREGTATAYAEDGQKVAESNYRDGHLLKEQRFENGKPVANK
jgi:antitoxin component YwqK of YwqJK toxin-antitoxin module